MSFAHATSKVREAVYALVAKGQSGDQLEGGSGTAFCIAPGVLVTASHSLHSPRFGGALRQHLEVLRAPDLAAGISVPEVPTVLADDPKRDLALLKIENPRSIKAVRLLEHPSRIGTPCGSVGFPLSESHAIGDQVEVTLFERFRGAYLSILLKPALFTDGPPVSCWETDAVMYPGSSGCPGYLEDGHVFGMHIRARLSSPVSDESDTTGSRMALSLWVASTEIIDFASRAGVKV
jgi:S1-C subfamily serine protease